MSEIQSRNEYVGGRVSQVYQILLCSNIITNSFRFSFVKNEEKVHFFRSHNFSIYVKNDHSVIPFPRKYQISSGSVDV